MVGTVGQGAGGRVLSARTGSFPQKASHEEHALPLRQLGYTDRILHARARAKTPRPDEVADGLVRKVWQAPPEAEGRDLAKYDASPPT